MPVLSSRCCRRALTLAFARSIAVKIHLRGQNDAVTPTRSWRRLLVYVAGKEHYNAKLDKSEANEEEIEPSVARIMMLFPGHSGLLVN